MRTELVPVDGAMETSLVDGQKIRRNLMKYVNVTACRQDLEKPAQDKVPDSHTVRDDHHSRHDCLFLWLAIREGRGCVPGIRPTRVRRRRRMLLPCGGNRTSLR